jgi:ABC transporter substrate binding protein (PQQ-dependent alcohol dehydrogenase system)
MSRLTSWLVLRPARLLLCCVGLVFAAAAGAADRIAIGYLSLERDARYDSRRIELRNLAQARGPALAGVEVALRESRVIGRRLGLGFELETASGRDADQLLEALERLHGEGVRFFVIDAPGEVVASLAGATRGREVMLFNASATEDELRQAQCEAHLMHTIPSDAMRADAIAQYLVSKNWRNVLLLRGPLEADARTASAFENAARRFGLRIVNTRDFVLSNDPRLRDQGNVALLTGGADHDVVFVADADGEFARGVPYATVRARPVVGAEGLAALAWHWSWDRHGAPQLSGRLERQADRRMADPDWAAWIAVKAVVEAAQRTESSNFGVLSEFIRGEEIILDGFKGNRLSFRDWDNQLRQPLLLATHNAVIERAPIAGFLHQHNNMDTLGFDRRDSSCAFDSR